MDALTPHLVAAELELAPGTDPAAVGAAVTVALCGHWEHPPPCYWPHNNAIDADAHPVAFRTVFAAPDDETPTVRGLIEDALRGADGWRVLRLADREPGPDERELGERLATGPRAAAPLV